VSALPSALVVLNPSAHGGTGARRFAAIRPELDALFDLSVVVGHADGAWVGDVRGALDRGTRLFIAAGGDGTAHTVLNALVDAPGRPPLDALTLGAVGLGSSNDLHKPVRARIEGVPVLLDASHAAPRDVVRCSYVDGAVSHHACILVSASLGVTACANVRFSEDSPTARRLREASTAAAIAWAALRTLVAWRNLPAMVRIDDGKTMRLALSSLNVLKTEWLSGLLRFGHSVEPDSGDFDVALAAGLRRTQLAFDILALLRGRFDGRPSHQRLLARSLDVRVDTETPLEMDGEIVAAHAVHFDVFPERIRLCA
jgi:diacylglycerol kinase (ATP)